MNVTASMVEFILRKRGIDAHVLANPDCVVETVRAYDGSHYEASVLYVVDGATPPVMPTPGDGAALLQAAMPSTAPSRSKRKKAKRPLPSLVEEGFAALRALDAWDAKLKDGLLQRASLAEFINLGAEMFSCPMAYFDCNLIVLAASEDYWDRGDATADAGLHIAGQMPSELAVDLVEDDDYLQAAKRLEPFYYENTQNRIFYGVNTFDGGEYLARLVFALPEGTSRFSRGEEQLIKLYHGYLDDLYLHYAGNVDIVSAQNDSLHALVRDALLEGKPIVAGEAAGILNSFGWAERDDFIAVRIVFFEGVHWDSISLYLCGLLERAMTASCAFPVERQIAWLVDLAGSAQPGESREAQLERLVETLVSIMRDYACKAGLGNVFSPLARAHAHYLEAIRALEVGQRHNPHHWYYHFRDYAFDYALAKSTEEFDGGQLCHPTLKTLLSYDAAHGTEYARTLVCFLRNNQNTSHAADELFIHRTSFMRRMAQIKKLADADLNDADEVLHLLLSAKLLGM